MPPKACRLLAGFLLSLRSCRILSPILPVNMRAFGLRRRRCRVAINARRASSQQHHRRVVAKPWRRFRKEIVISPHHQRARLIIKQ